MYAFVRFWLPLTIALGAAALPLHRHYRMQGAEQAVAAALEGIAQAQEQFRAATGGYAADFASLAAGCPPSIALIEQNLADALIASHGYRLAIRSAAAGQIVGTDCHGRAVVSDYYVSAEPQRVGVDGRRAMAATASRRVYVFLDGVAPGEDDMAAGGLALPLETLETLKIP